MFDLLRFSSLILIIGVLISCAANYYPISPLTIDYQDATFLEVDSNISIGYKYDVLRQAGNKKYARFEKRWNVSLLALFIDNKGTDTLYVPDDLVFLDGEIPVMPFELEELQMLYQTNTDLNRADSDWAADIPWWVSLGFGSWNLIKSERADESLMEELENYYLIYSLIYPGTRVSGLIVLPIERNTPLSIIKR
jgi:hypothetical protein